MPIQLAPDADKWHRLWSVRVAVLGAAVSVGSVVFPGLLGIISPLEHPFHYAAISTAFFLITVLARVVDQPSLDNGH
jgi:hypothetical protein